MERLSSEGGARLWRGWALFHFEEQHVAGVTKNRTRLSAHIQCRGVHDLAWERVRITG